MDVIDVIIILCYYIDTNYVTFQNKKYYVGASLNSASEKVQSTNV